MVVLLLREGLVCRMEGMGALERRDLMASTPGMVEAVVVRRLFA